MTEPPVGHETAKAGSGLHLLPGCVLHRLVAADWEQVLSALAERVVAGGYGKPSLVPAVLARERKYPTGLPTAVPSAIPHTDAEHVIRPGLAVATLADSVEFGVMGGSGETLQAEVVVMLCVDDPATQVAGLQQVLAVLGSATGVGRLVSHDDPATFEVAVRSWLEAEA
jgi:galactitol PTS system EIIA component